VFAPGGAYHLTARGVHDGAIFHTAFDCFAMLALLRQVTKRCEWTVLAWCFMHTHYHLVVLTAAEPAVSDAMHRVNGTYAREFNLRHHRRGHLFGQRYSPTLIEDARHLAAACGYVLLNPVTAGLVKSVEDWAWSGDGRLEARPTAHNGYELVARA
jgi:REP element-mobilizing transposase RayT